MESGKQPPTRWITASAPTARMFYIHAGREGGVSPDAVDGFVAELIEAAKLPRKNDAEGIASESGEVGLRCSALPNSCSGNGLTGVRRGRPPELVGSDVVGRETTPVI